MPLTSLLRRLFLEDDEQNTLPDLLEVGDEQNTLPDLLEVGDEESDGTSPYLTAEDAGALPGSFKNLLDWTVGGGETYGIPVAWINASGSPTGAADAHRSLRTVLGYTGSDIVEEACAHIPVARSAVGSDRLIADKVIRRQIADALGTLASQVGKRIQPSGQRG